MSERWQVSSSTDCCGCSASDGGPSVVTINLPQILAFVTGSDSIPPMGFASILSSSSARTKVVFYLPLPHAASPSPSPLA